MRGVGLGEGRNGKRRQTQSFTDRKAQGAKDCGRQDGRNHRRTHDAQELFH